MTLASAAAVRAALRLLALTICLVAVVVEGVEIVERTGRCNDNARLFKLTLDTDAYPWETSWALVGASGEIAAGPPANTNYARRNRYIGFWCLDIGEDYTLTMKDLQGDGICCAWGQGSFVGKLDDEEIFRSDDSDYKKLSFDFSVKTRLTRQPTKRPTTQPTRPVTFVRGDLSQEITDLGLRISTGMSVRVIARANQRVRYASGGLSGRRFHSMPDGATVTPLEGGGYAYVSNAEMEQRRGGVYAVYFDDNSNVIGYRVLLSGTTRNCSGGKSPWNTWISCEETGRGQCFQVTADPRHPNFGRPQETKLGGNGGNFEAVAVDGRDPAFPVFFVSEDAGYGALRRYTGRGPPGWDYLHRDGGDTQFLEFIPGSNRFRWTFNEQASRNSQFRYYPNVEGIDCDDNGFLYFVSKRRKMLYKLDLDRGTYITVPTNEALEGQGSFADTPDNIDWGNDGNFLYFTEDGGPTAGVYAREKSTGKMYAMFEALWREYKGDEATGLAFSPDGSKMYACFQDCGCPQESSETGLDFTCGCMLEFSRDDGYSFDGAPSNLRFHSKSNR